VLLHDFLCSKNGIAAAHGPIKEAILRHKTRLKSEYVKAQVLNKANFKGTESVDTGVIIDFVPRWVRVNTLKTRSDEIVEQLYGAGLVAVANLDALKANPNGYLSDINIPNLFALHPSYPLMTTFKDQYSSGAIILQDKASCLPAQLLGPPIGATVLDACAAPGNKTTQLAAAVSSSGTVFAIEKDSKRAETLRLMVEKAGAAKCT
jgi:25S rRNA (cytosine2278-C5)-methyltransferase